MRRPRTPRRTPPARRPSVERVARRSRARARRRTRRRGRGRSERAHVVGGVHAARLAALVGDVADVDAPSRGSSRSASATPATRKFGRRLVNRLPGPMTTRSACAQRVERRRVRRRRRPARGTTRRSGPSLLRRRAAWPAIRPPSHVSADEHDVGRASRAARGRARRAVAPAASSASGKPPSMSASAAMTRLPSAWPASPSPVREAVLEDARERRCPGRRARRGSCGRRRAAACRTRARSWPERAAVVGDRDDGGRVEARARAGTRARAAGRCPPPMATARRVPLTGAPGPCPMSRWLHARPGSRVRAGSRRSRSASTTLRCMPPVQPIAIDRCVLPSAR